MGIVTGLRRWRAALVLLLLGACTAAPAAPPPASAAIPPGAARFWFYRLFVPDDTKDMPAVAMNGAIVGYALAGSSFYRDAPAGRYHLTVESFGRDFSQSKDLVAVPGQEIYVKIDSEPSWESSAIGSYRRGTYYVMLPPPQVAAVELTQTFYTPGY